MVLKLKAMYPALRPEVGAGASVALTGRAGIVRSDAGVVSRWDTKTVYLVWRGLGLALDCRWD